MTDDSKKKLIYDNKLIIVSFHITFDLSKLKKIKDNYKL